MPTNTLSTARPTDAAVPPELPEQATAPPPSTAGPVTARNLPAPEKLGQGWRTYVDPGGAEMGFLGNQTWTRSREAHQAAYEALPVGCANPLPSGSLPVPEHALQGSYRTAGNGPATVLLLRFGEPEKASSYYKGYQARMSACGAGAAGLMVDRLWSEDAAAASVRRYTGAEVYVEVSVLRGSTVALLAAESSDPAGQVGWTHRVAPELMAVIDQP
ncbi:MAG TPA: hypothetical protein VFT31_11530 [Kribbella sp.]|nr:hypothetical protein [Kribbella sp.]